MPPDRDESNEFKVGPWNLDDLYPGLGSEEVRATRAEIANRVADFEQVRSELHPSMTSTTLFGIIGRLEEIYRLRMRLYAYADLLSAQDERDLQAREFLNEVARADLDADTRTALFYQWWCRLDRARAEDLAAGVGEYGPWLLAVHRRNGVNLLSEEEEEVAREGVGEFRALERQYQELAVACRDEASYGATQQFDKKAKVRRAAYEQAFAVYAGSGEQMGEIYRGIVNAWRREHVELRGASTPISGRNRMNDISDEVIDDLLQTCNDNTAVFQKLMRRVAGKLGLAGLTPVDFLVPELHDSSQNYDFNTTAQSVIKAWASFGGDNLGQRVKRVFDEGHVDSEWREGKRPGRFTTPTGPGITPYISMMYQTTFEDQGLLGHETGHAVHFMMAGDRGALMMRSPVLVEETAAAFSEVLLADLLRVNASSDQERRGILVDHLITLMQAIHDQAFIAIFEQEAHARVYEGATTREICRMYRDNLIKQYGALGKITKVYEWGWLRVHHVFLHPFYSYAYPFTYLLALVLYERYVENPVEFKNRFINILRMGGAASPSDLMQLAGMNVSSKEIWQRGFDIVAELVEAAG